LAKQLLKKLRNNAISNAGQKRTGTRKHHDKAH
jgi:hypothetical protein